MGSPGDRVFRGSIDTTGQFALNNNWVWGWDGTLVTDKLVIQDYGLRSYFAADGPVQVRRPGNRHAALSDAAAASAAISMRAAMYFYGLASSDVQSQLPIIHPVIDYRNKLA